MVKQTHTQTHWHLIALEDRYLNRQLAKIQILCFGLDLSLYLSNPPTPAPPNSPWNIESNSAPYNSWVKLLRILEILPFFESKILSWFSFKIKQCNGSNVDLLIQISDLCTWILYIYVCNKSTFNLWFSI